MESLADYEDLLLRSAERFRLDINLIKAIVMVESSGVTWTTRFEPGSTLLNNPSDYARKLGITQATEEMHQHTSFGLMQVMGFLARDLGFLDHLTMLCQPEIGLFYGCKYLRKLSDKYGYEPEIVSAYNAGSPGKTPGGMFRNQVYVDKIYKQLRELRQLV